MYYLLLIFCMKRCRLRFPLNSYRLLCSLIWAVHFCKEKKFLYEYISHYSWWLQLNEFVVWMNFLVFRRVCVETVTILQVCLYCLDIYHVLLQSKVDTDASYENLPFSMSKMWGTVRYKYENEYGAPSVHTKAHPSCRGHLNWPCMSSVTPNFNNAISALQTSSGCISNQNTSSLSVRHPHSGKSIMLNSACSTYSK